MFFYVSCSTRTKQTLSDTVLRALLVAVRMHTGKQTYFFALSALLVIRTKFKWHWLC